MVILGGWVFLMSGVPLYFQDPGLGFRVSCIGFQVWGLSFNKWPFKPNREGFEFRYWASGFRVRVRAGPKIRVSDFGIRVPGMVAGLGLRIPGSGIRDSGSNRGKCL